MDNERIAKLEEQGRWIATKVDRIDVKIDVISDKLSLWVGKTIGASVVISLIAVIVEELIRK